MDDTRPMSSRQHCANLFGNLHAAALGHFSSRLKKRIKIDAPDIFHDEVWRLVADAKVQDLHGIGMTKRAGSLCFALESFLIGVRKLVLLQDLDGDDAVGEAVSRFEDDTH